MSMDVLWDFIMSVLGGILADYLTYVLSRIFRALKDSRKGK